MENEIVNESIQQKHVSISRFFWLLVGIGAMYFGWPIISQVNLLSPPEQEVHGYLKEIIPAVRSTLQKFKQLDEEPENMTFPSDLARLSSEIDAINERYWKTGDRSETFVQIIIDKMQGKIEDKDFFLTSWEGPEKDAAPLLDMRMDTQSLLLRAWVIKEHSEVLAKAFIDMPKKIDLKGENAILDARDLITDSWRILADVDQIHRRWKGNYRSPIAFSSKVEKG